MPLDKVRIRFRKSGDLRLVSHLDLMRSFERMLRRAALPFRMTQGFHPTPRLVLAQSLPLGVIGHSEVAELELTEEIEPDEVLRRLREQAPPGIEFLTAQRIPIKATARPRRAVYRIPLNPVPACQVDDIPGAMPTALRGHADGGESGADMPTQSRGHGTRASILTVNNLPDRCRDFLAATEVWAERERPRPRQVNIRPYVEALTVADDALMISVWLTQEGSARADEIAAALGMVDPPVIERVELELLDEVPPDVAARTPKIEPQSRPLNRVFSTEPVPAAPRETWGATANGPVVE